MEVKEKIKNIIKNNELDKLSKYKKSTLSNMYFALLNDELDNFSYEDSDIDYLETIINMIPDLIDKNNSNNMYKNLKEIHQKLKTYLFEHPDYIDNTNYNYHLLKTLINDIEVIEMSILYDCIDKYQGSKYELIDYIIFNMKNISVFNDALNRFPHLVNYFDKDGKNLIASVTDEYLKAVNKYDNGKNIDDILYYDQVIDSIIKSEKFMFDIIDKQTILTKTKEFLKNIDSDKEKKTFYFNSLIEKVNKKQIEHGESYYEYKCNISTIFTEAVKSEVRQVIDNYSISKGRRIIDDYIVSFDGEDAKEIDDALSIKVLDNGNMLLGVHIADPLDVIDTNSIIFEEAANRTTSIYIGNKSIPMLPSEISTDLISLKQNNYRPAISYYFEFDKNGNLVKSDFVKSIIEVNRNLTYKDFNRISNMNSNDKLKKTVDNLSIMSSFLQNYYNVDPLYGEINRGSNNITNTNIIGSSTGEKVVESSMIFTNQMVAKYFAINNLPFNFRNHNIDQEVLYKLDRIRDKIIKEYSDSDAYLRYIDMVKNLYPKAEYGLECKGHHGLDIKYYSHVTSPLRRLADMICLICLYQLYFKEPTKESKENVAKLVLKYSDLINGKRNSIEKYAALVEKTA